MGKLRNRKEKEQKKKGVETREQKEREEWEERKKANEGISLYLRELVSSGHERLKEDSQFQELIPQQLEVVMRLGPCCVAGLSSFLPSDSLHVLP